MAIDIKEWNKDFITYAVVPEKVDDIQVKEIKEENHDLGDGWSTDRARRKIGEIPYSVLYNYALGKGIPSHKHNDFYSENNCENIKKLLNEFEIFRVGGKL